VPVGEAGNPLEEIAGDAQDHASTRR
jgi:hypothetical protein